GSLDCWGWQVRAFRVLSFFVEVGMPEHILPCTARVLFSYASLFKRRECLRRILGRLSQSSNAVCILIAGNDHPICINSRIGPVLEPLQRLIQRFIVAIIFGNIVLDAKRSEHQPTWQLGPQPTRVNSREILQISNDAT